MHRTLATALTTPLVRGTVRWVPVIAGAYLLGDYLAVAPIGTTLLRDITFIAFAPLLLGAPLAVLISPFFLFSKRHRKSALAHLLAATLTLTFTLPAFVFGHHLRRAAFHDLAERSAPLVAAIHRYTDETGSPPSSLDALVPDYLPEVPSTGMMAHPDYDYYFEPGGLDPIYRGNPWILTVNTFGPGIGWDRFYYWPLRNYPTGSTIAEHGFSGYFSPVGDWAYFHE